MELAEIIHQAVSDNRSYLMEHETKEILEGIGIATTGFLVARSEDEALAMSEKIGFPVVLKIVSPDVVHKTDAGGVKLNLTCAEDVRKAYREILETFKYQHIEGVTIQKMAKPGIEAIIGVTRDPSFGPLIMFGLGGVFVEVSARCFLPDSADHRKRRLGNDCGNPGRRHSGGISGPGR